MTENKQEKVSAFPAADVFSYIFNYSGNAFLAGFGVGAVRGYLSKTPIPSIQDSKLQTKHFTAAKVFHNSFKYAINSMLLASAFTSVDAALAKLSHDQDPQSHYVWWHKALAGASAGSVFSLASLSGLAEGRIRVLLITCSIGAVAGIALGHLTFALKKVEIRLAEEEAKKKALMKKKQDDEMEKKISLINQQGKLAKEQMQMLEQKE